MFSINKTEDRLRLVIFLLALWLVSCELDMPVAITIRCLPSLGFLTQYTQGNFNCSRTKNKTFCFSPNTKQGRAWILISWEKLLDEKKKGWLWWRMGLLFRDIQNTCTPTYRLTTWSSNAFVKSKVATFIKNLVYLVAAIERGAFCFCFKQFTTNNYEFRLKPRINQMVLRHFS